MQGYAESAKCTRDWLTKTYTSKHFNDYVRNSIKIEVVKRIIVNGLTGGNSWYFKRFNRLTVKITSVNDSRRIMSG